MKLIAKVGVFALALILTTAPTMACLLPTVTLTAAEQECCKQMMNQCGRAGMPSSHSCCERLSGPETITFVKAPGFQLDHIASSGHVSTLSAAHLLTDIPLFQASLDFGVYAPPGSPPSPISVLRI